MKTLILLSFMLCSIIINAQTYVNLQGGWAATTLTETNTLTYQIGARHQFNEVGLKLSFNQTDGINHTFDSYTISGTFQPLDFLYVSAGYRYDNGRGWGDNSNNFNTSVNGLIFIQNNVDLILTTDYSSNGIFNLIVGVQLDFLPVPCGSQRFY